VHKGILIAIVGIDESKTAPDDEKLRRGAIIFTPARAVILSTFCVGTATAPLFLALNRTFDLPMPTYFE
jgi:hypothetical protein